MTTIEATWAVTYRNPDTDDLLFLFFLPVVAEPRDRIQTVVEAIFKQRFPKGPLWQRHPDDFIYLFHELPQWPCSVDEPNATIEHHFTTTVTADYLRNMSITRVGSYPYNKLKWRETLLVIVEPNVDERSSTRSLGMVAEEGRGDRDVVVHAAQKRESPSKGAKLSALRKTQKPGRADAIHNFRPKELEGPPIQIYHPAFATFLNAMENTQPHAAADLDSAYTFVNMCSELYDNEAQRQAGMIAMSRVVHETVLSTTALSVTGEIRPDGSVRSRSPNVTDEFDPIVCIHELKNEIGEGQSDPLAQAECCYVAIYCSEKANALTRVSPCPCILIGTAGPNIVVSGAVFADCIISQRLTGYVSVVPLDTLKATSRFADAVGRVAQLFRALRITIAELDAYYRQLEVPQSALPPPSSTSRQNRSSASANLSALPLPFIGPWFNEFQLADGTKVTLEYTEHFTVGLDRSKAVFKATATKHSGADRGGNDEFPVVVKFMRTYSREGHELLAAHEPPLAPRLWYFGRLENTAFYVVVMDYVEHRSRPLTPSDRTLLKSAVDLLHKNGLVFGDLREPNVLRRSGGGVMLIDFEWCGKEGEARYPLDICMDREMPWHSTVKREGLVTKQHDLHLLHKLTSRRA